VSAAHEQRIAEAAQRYSGAQRAAVKTRAENELA